MSEASLFCEKLTTCEYADSIKDRLLRVARVILVNCWLCVVVL